MKLFKAMAISVVMSGMLATNVFAADIPQTQSLGQGNESVQTEISKDHLQKPQEVKPAPKPAPKPVPTTVPTAAPKENIEKIQSPAPEKGKENLEKGNPNPNIQEPSKDNENVKKHKGGSKGHGHCENCKKKPLANLVENGTITQAQADAIRGAMKAAWKSKKSVNDVLDELVKAGTITQAQKEAIVQSFPIRR